MIALLIGYESITRIFAPVPIHFTEAIPIAFLGLAVNIASAWLLSEGRHHGHRAHDDDHEEPDDIATPSGRVRLEVFEDGVPPRFRLYVQSGPALTAQAASVETIRPDGTRQVFIMRDRGDFLESVAEIPEPHAFTANVRIGQDAYPVTLEEHEHAQGFAASDNNMRAAVIHVIADAAVSVLVIVGLLLARAFGWLWMDALAGIIGACVIASWSYGLIRDTGAILLDMNPDRTMAGKLGHAVEGEGDQLADLHLWRLGPGHLGAIVSVVTAQPREANYYRSRLARFPSLSHLTVEVTHRS
jgi:cation diffusion facilitator family transporter